MAFLTAVGFFIYFDILGLSFIFLVLGIEGKIKTSSRLVPVFFSLVIISSGFTAAFNSNLGSLREDTIPAGAFVVPWMHPHGCNSAWRGFSPDTPKCGARSLMYLGVDMQNALMLNTTINIVTPNETLPIRGLLFLGHDSDNLYVVGEFNNTKGNPFEPPYKPSINSSGSFFQLLLDADNDGKLSTPESGVYLGEAYCNHNYSACGSTLSGWGQWPVNGYFDLAWSNSIPDLNHPAWDFASNLCPQFQTWHGFLEIGAGPDFLVFQFTRSLRMPGSCANAMQIYPGEVWVMGFLIEFGYYLLSGSYHAYVGGWPRTAYPYLSTDASWWPKIAFDMTNPPANFTPNS